MINEDAEIQILEAFEQGPRGPQGIQGPPGTTDHGALQGLNDDDHPQYHTDSRGDARYYTKSQVQNLVTDAVNAVLNGAPDALNTLKELADAVGNDPAFAVSVATALSGKAPSSHTHAIEQITGLQSALDGKQAAGSYAPAAHTHPVSDVPGLQVTLDGLAAEVDTKANAIALYASDYGVSAANSAAANATALLAAIKAAIAAVSKLVMPPGDIKCGQVLGSALTSDATQFAIGNNTLHIEIPSGCRILRQNGVWWLKLDTSDECVRYDLSSAAFVNGSANGQIGGDPSNLYIYSRALALGVANASAIRKYDRATLRTVPDSGYLVTNDSGDDYGYPVEDLHVLDVNYTTNVVYLSQPKYKAITAKNSTLFHWPNRDALLKITGEGGFILDPASGNYESDTLADAREMIYTIGCRTEILGGGALYITDSDRGLAHIQRTLGSVVDGITTRRTRNQSQGASNTRKLTYVVDDYANKALRLSNIEVEGSRHINTGNTAKTTNRFLFGPLVVGNPVGFYYDASSSSLVDGDEVYIDQAGGTTQLNQKYYTLTGSKSFSGSVETITNANPAVLTYSGSTADLANDRKVLISGVAGMTQVNGNWYTVKNLNTSAKTFELWNAAGTAAIDATGYGTFVAGVLDKVGFGFAQLAGIDGSAYTPYTSGGWAFKVSDWKNNGYTVGNTSWNIRGRIGQGNNVDSHAGQCDSHTMVYSSTDNVQYFNGLINPKGGSFRGNGDSASNIVLKNMVQAWTFDGMSTDHAGCPTNLYSLTNLESIDPIWWNDLDHFQFAGSTTKLAKSKAILSNVRLRGNAIGRIAGLAAGCGEVVFDNLSVQCDLARVATGTSSRYLFNVFGGNNRLVIKDTILDFRDSNILDSTGAISTAALKRFGTMFDNCEVVLDNVKILGMSKFDPRYGLFGTNGSGVKSIKTRNLFLDDPLFPVSGVAAAAKTVSAATATNPVVLTITGHGYSNNDLIFLSGLSQMTQLNNTLQKVTVLTANTISIAVNGTSYAAETTGGSAQKITTPSDVTITKQDAAYALKIDDLTNVAEPATPVNAAQYALVYNSTTKEYTMVPVAPAAGSSGQLNIPFNVRADSGLSLTAMTLAEQFFPANAKRVLTKQDLSNYTQARLVVNVTAASASVNTPRIKAKFSTAFNYATDTVSAMTDLGVGATEVAVSLATAGVIPSAWVDLHASAKADVFLALTQLGGDGSVTPGVGSVILQLR